MKSLYLRSAQAFIKVLPTVVADFKKAVDSDMYTATMQMHTVKGNAALLGATALVHAAAQLEKQCKTNPEVQKILQLVTPLEQALDATATSLAHVIAHLQSEVDVVPQAEANVNASLPPGEGVSQEVASALISRLQSLNALLANADLAALEKFSEIRTEFGDAVHEKLMPLENALQSLELEDAYQHSMALIALLTAAI